MRRLELAAIAVILAGGTWLRIVHVGTPSLWWDELVHIRTAEQPDARAVWHAVRDGVAPGTGNAAAVPLDYLALHAWLRMRPRPEPAALERHYRTPSAVMSVVALPAMWALARTLGGPAAGLTAAALLALSIPHVLYAAEARYYSLYVLTTIASLAAFVGVLRAPEDRVRWAVFSLTNAAYVLSALYGVFPVAAEVAVLALATRRARRSFAMLGIAAAAVGAVVASYVAPSAIATVYPRGEPAAIGPLAALVETLRFVASGDPVLVGLALSTPLLAWRARRRDAGTVLVVVALAMTTVWVMVAVAQWKHYYYHPRHALFLLPMVVLTAAIGVGVVADAIGGRAGAIVAAAVAGLLVARAIPAIAGFVANPAPHFHQTKTLRDFAGLARALVARTAVLPRERPYVLLVERNRPGHLANPTLAFYLDAYGLTDRVALRGFDDPPAMLARVARACPGGCPPYVGPGFAPRLEIGDPFDQLPPVRQLLGLRVHPWRGGHLGDIGVVVWAPHAPPAAPPGLTRTAFDGFALFAPRR